MTASGMPCDVLVDPRPLGATGLVSSALGFGGNRLAEADDRREALATFDRALELGVNHIDLADAYGHGEAEQMVGRMLRGRRERVILCSKVGYRPGLSVRLGRWVDPLRRRLPSRPRTPGIGSRPRPRDHFAPRTLAAGIRGSLRRLATDHLDVFYLHSPSPEVVADETVLRWLEAEQVKGNIRHYGVSFPGEATTADILSALRHPGFSVFQIRVNPLQTVDLHAIGAAAAAGGVALVVHEPLQKGQVLTSERLAPHLSAHPQRTAPQTALRAVLQRPEVDVVLVGTTKRAHLDDNIAALAAPPLTDREMDAIWAGAKVS